MPYLRLYLPNASVEQKRFIAQNLIEITLRAFNLCSEDRCQVSVEFVSRSRQDAADWLLPSTLRDTDFVLEVLGHDLTEEQQRVFSEEAASMLAQILPVKARRRFARLFGIKKTDAHCPVALQFSELSPAVSEPYVIHPRSRAA